MTNPRWQKITLLLISTLTIMSGATISPSLPAMQEAFSGVANADVWVRLVLTLPALFIVLSAPLAGIITDKFGRKPLLIAHISYGGLEYQGADERYRGHRQALEEAGSPFDPALLREGNYSAESGFLAMISLLEARTDFSAVFVSNDTVALGAMAALRQHGLRIPEDIAVVGYDDIPMAAYAAPPLTTIRSPALEHGRSAGEMLINLIHGKPVYEAQVQLELDLIIRESCGARARAGTLSF